MHQAQTFLAQPSMLPFRRPQVTRRLPGHDKRARQGRARVP